MSNLVLGAGGAAADAYTIDQSLRFERTSPSYLSRTPGSAGSLTTWTWSGWVKRGDITNANTLFGWVYVGGGGSPNQQHIIVLRSDETISQEMYNAPTTAYVYQKKSAAVLRDPSAWYHIVSVFDSTNSTGEDRSRLYINGERVTDWSADSDPAEDLDGYINTTVEHGIGAGLPYDTSASGEQFSGLLAEVYFIDGQALDADDFGETDSTTNQWKPIDASGLTFGTNGFYQKYAATELANSFTDSAFTHLPVIPYSSMTTSTAQKKFGTASGLFVTTSDSIVFNFNNSSADIGGGHTGSLNGSSSFVTDIKKYGSYAIDNPGGDGNYWITDTSTDYDLCNSDFTISWWQYFDQATSEEQFVIQGDNGSIQINKQYDGGEDTNKSYLKVNLPDSAGTNYGSGSAFDWSNATWYWYTVERYNDVVRFYVNDSLQMSAPISGTWDTEEVRLGAGSSSNSHLDDLVIVPWSRWQGNADNIVVPISEAITLKSALTVPTSADFDINSGDFTVELWARLSSVSDEFVFLSNSSLDTPYTGWILDWDTSDLRFLFASDSTTWRICSKSWSPSADTWYHIAAVRDSGTTELFVDGTSIGTESLDYAAVDAGRRLHIGERIDGKFTFPGYMDELRISNTARYTGNFSVATAAFETDANTMLLLHMDGSNGGTTFTDSSDRTGRHTITANGDVTQTRAVKKVGDSSIVFDADGDYLTIPDSSDWDIDFSSSWTWEFWMNAVVPPEDYAGIICHNVDDNYSPGWGIVFNNASYLMLVSLASHASSAVESSSTIPNGGWHHYAFVHDNSADTMKLYIDGALDATGSTTAITLPDVTGVLTIGRHYVDDRGFEGYLDEIRLSDTARYTGTFTPSTTEFTADANTLLLIHSNWNGGFGLDSSGNENDFAATNLVATDKMLDSPTSSFATFNPIVKSNAQPTYTEGNLKGTPTSDGGGNILPTTWLVESGKWYWEIRSGDSSGGQELLGIASEKSTKAFSSESNPQTVSSFLYISDGDKRVDGTITSYGASYTSGDIIGIALNMTDTEITFYKNNVSQTTVSITGDCATGAVVPCGMSAIISAMHLNTGADSSFAGTETAQGNQDSNEIGDFYYEPPTDFLALCTSNLPDPEIKLPGDNFNTVLYTGTDSSNAITGVGFKPDLLSIKNRSSAEGGLVFDVERGQNYLQTNNDDVEGDGSAFFTSLDSDGFTVTGTDGSANASGDNYVAWNWLGGGTAVANTTGTLDAMVSANTTAGFSIVKFDQEGTGADATIGHGLSQRPELVIGKPYDAGDNWRVGGDFIASTVDWGEILLLNDNRAAYTKDSVFDGGDNPGGPTASIIYMGDDGLNNTGYESILYCFHSVEGYSKLGSYTGNGNDDGTFIYTGFRPAYFLFKKTNAGDSWYVMDDKRNTYNLVTNTLKLDSSAAEESDAKGDCDFVSNGIKFRINDTGNDDAATYLYMAFAESPFKYANAR